MSRHHQSIRNLTSQLTASAALTSLLLSALVIAGCKQSGTQSAEQVRVEKPVAPPPSQPCQQGIVSIALLQDKSGSTGQTRTPQITMEHIDLLVNFIRPCGGEIGFGLINEQSNSSLHRLRIEAPLVGAPKEPEKNGNPFQVQRDLAGYRKAKARYDRTVQTLESETDRRIATFKSQISPLLNAPPTARRSDFFGGIQRANLFLSENSAAWPSPPHQILLVVGDGLDNVRSKHEALQKTTRLILVNGSASVGALSSLGPTRFENIESAIQFVMASERQTSAPGSL